MNRHLRMAMVIAMTVVATSLVSAYAQVDGEQISACARKSDGALRIAKKCASNERAVTWSIAGPQGTAGLNGANGADGRLRDLRTRNVDDADYTVPAGYVGLATLSSLGASELSAGYYRLHATVRGRFSSFTDDNAVSCYWQTDTDSATNVARRGGAWYADDVWNVFTLHVYANFEQSAVTPERVHLVCRFYASVSSVGATIVAGQVGSITPLPIAMGTPETPTGTAAVALRRAAMTEPGPPIPSQRE